jgi:hypothetical protein
LAEYLDTWRRGVGIAPDNSYPPNFRLLLRRCGKAQRKKHCAKR